MIKSMETIFDKEKLIAFRKKAGLSQRDLAFKLGMTPQQYNEIEKGGRTPSLFMCARIGKALGVSTTYFIKEPE